MARNHPCSVGLGPWGVRGKGVGRQSAVFRTVLVAVPLLGVKAERRAGKVTDRSEERTHGSVDENNLRRCSVRQDLTQLSAHLGRGVRAATGIMARLCLSSNLPKSIHSRRSAVCPSAPSRCLTSSFHLFSYFR